MNREPLVACVMLVDGRPDMTRRAIASYRAQTYVRKRLLALDSSSHPVESIALDVLRMGEMWLHTAGGKSIGALRNEANDLTGCDAIAHFDSDDWSHPDRLALEVAALVVSGCDAVGFHDALFWDSTKCQIRVDPSKPLPCGGVQGTVESVGECWRYTAQHPDGVIGASLLYWRSVWEKHPFPDRNAGEDTLWLMRRNVYALPSVTQPEPRMVCEIHGGNTASRVAAGHKEWRRASQWDKYCNEVMKL